MFRTFAFAAFLLFTFSITLGCGGTGSDPTSAVNGVSEDEWAAFKAQQAEEQKQADLEMVGVTE